MLGHPAPRLLLCLAAAALNPALQGLPRTCSARKPKRMAREAGLENVAEAAQPIGGFAGRLHFLSGNVSVRYGFWHVVPCIRKCK